MTLGGISVEFNSINKAHLTVISNYPKQLANTIYSEIQLKEDLDVLSIKVLPNELSTFVQELVAEIKLRRAYLSKHNCCRVDDYIKEHKASEVLKKAFITLLLPMSVSNQNLCTLKDMLCKTVPLGIHFIVILPYGANKEFINAICDNTYWVYQEEEGRLDHK